MIGERLLMRNPIGGPAAAIMDTGDADWVFVQTNVRYDLRDQFDWKFLDRISTIESNGAFDKLVVDYAVDSFLFETPQLRERFEKSSILSAYADLFTTAEIKNVS